MTNITYGHTAVNKDISPANILVVVSIVATGMLMLIGDRIPWAVEYPAAWELPVADNISRFMNWLLNEADLGLFTFKEFTRAFGALLDQPTLFLKGLLATGFKFELASGETLHLPPLSWVAVTAIFVSFGLALKDPRLSAFILMVFVYVAVIGLWKSTMLTVASIVVAVVIGVVFGVLLGVASHRWKLVEQVLTPVFDFMQTMPVFAYLVPAIMLFGYGPAAALVVTLIYAMPPMARVTASALKQVGSEIIEFGRMAGCSQRQLIWRVMLPAIRPRLMIGVNQVIMLTLNMVIIASMIGAGGLGYDVWQALKALRIGQGAEAGIAITLVAIVLDRVSQRYAARRPVHIERGGRQNDWRFRVLVMLSLVFALTVIGTWFPPISRFPEEWTVTTGRFWDGIIDWININLYTYIGAAKDFLFIYLLKPVKNFMLQMPWLGATLIVAAMGFRLGGPRLSVTCAALVAFIATVGLWEKAMTSVYLVGVCVFLSSVIGIPIGIAAALNDKVHNVIQIIIDTLQTLPSFVYLIPVIMLFGIGDFSAMIAVVMYAIVPAIRYTDSGLRQVPEKVIEAARSFGCTRSQILRRVYLPLALPDIMLGINQTLMMGLSMLVITALVGTRDLGQETLIALSKVDPGRGLTAGICVAFIAITADRLITAWANGRKRELGLDAD